MGIYSITGEISDVCPKCGSKRGTKIWDGHSFDGSRRLNVTCWTNECEHIDFYEDVREEIRGIARAALAMEDRAETDQPSSGDMLLDELHANAPTPYDL